ncbi:MAG: hybrid sensor histidine kinase/response regulator [Polyangiales bacterium]
MMSRALHVLLVEDDDDDFLLVSAMARKLPGWTLERVSDADAALEKLRVDPTFDACLLDLRLGAEDGFEVLASARAAGYAAPVIVLTGASERETINRALTAGAADYLVKGVFDENSLERAVRFAVAQHHLSIAHVARAEAEAAARAMDELVATLSHELRAPLHTMRLAIAALAAPSLGEAERGRAKTLLERGLGRLERTVEDLLDAARSERGELAVERKPVDLASVARSATEALRTLHPTRTLDLSVEECAPILGDALRLEQVVENLVGNALRHASDASVCVRVRCDGDHAFLRVEDDGPGFPPQLLGRVFDRFAKGEVAHRRGGGLGLGLAIVRAIAEAHEATITASNDGPNGGAAVTLSFRRGA